MNDMGWKPKKSDMPQPVEASSEPKIQYPRMYIDHNVPTELMSKDIGAMCRLEVIARVVSKSIDSRSDGEKSERLEFEIHKLGYKSAAGKKTKDEYKEMNEDEREEYDREDKGIDEEEEKK